MSIPRRCFWLLLSLFLTACGSEPVGISTPSIAAVVSTPFPAFAADAATTLHDQPGGAPTAPLARGTDLLVQASTIAADGQLWYQVATTTGASGWLPSAAVNLVDDQLAATPTPRPTAVAPASSTPRLAPTPRPLVVTGSGQGLFLRKEPGQGEVIRSYPDGTAVVALGEETRIEGRVWRRVRAPDGAEGWMAGEYLRTSS